MIRLNEAGKILIKEVHLRRKSTDRAVLPGKVIKETHEIKQRSLTGLRNYADVF